MPYSGLEAQRLLVRGDAAGYLARLEKDATSHPEAAHLLGAVLHGAAGSSVPMDVTKSALSYTRCVNLCLDRAKRDGVRPHTLSHPATPLFLDALHAVGAAITFEEVAAGSEAHTECCMRLSAAHASAAGPLC
jgi:hypothetical protein